MCVNARSSWQPLKFLHMGLQLISGKREYLHKTMRILHSPHKFLLSPFLFYLNAKPVCVSQRPLQPGQSEHHMHFLSLLFWFILNIH